MPLKEKFRQKFDEPETKAFLLRFFWIISLFMLVLGYGIMAYVWFYT
jgi:phage shock protein PspC (stress-responsive transcriptional regulator)